MTTDITSALMDAKAKASQWTRNRFVDTLETLAGVCKEARVDWDSGAVEKWGSVLDGGMHAMLRLDIPFAIVFEPEAGPLRELLEARGIVVVSASHWDSEELSADWEVAHREFPYWGFPEFGNPDLWDPIFEEYAYPASFSANDLCWWTIT